MIADTICDHPEAYMKTITKVNGNWIANRVFKIYDPGSGIRYEAFDWVGHNAITIFSIWK